MSTAPSRAVVIDTRPTARSVAESRWAGQEPGNRIRRRQMARRHRVIDAQLGLCLAGAVLAALTLPAWWGPALMIAGWIVPALVGGWLDTYRPIGRERPRRNALAIAVRLDQGAAQ